MRESIIIIFITGLAVIAEPLLAQGRSTVVIRPIDKADTLAKFLGVVDIRTTNQEREKHKIIWERAEVRTAAMKHAVDGGVVYTMTDDGTNLKRDKYVIGLYLLQGELEKKLGTFKINKAGQVSGQLATRK